MMKKLATFALIFTTAIATNSYAEEIKPQKKVLFEKCVCSKNPNASWGGCGLWTIRTTVTGVEWLDKELNTLLYQGIKATGMHGYKGKNKTNESKIKEAMEEEYQFTSEFFNDDSFGHSGAIIPQTCDKLTNMIDNNPYELAGQGLFLDITFKEQKGNSLIFHKKANLWGYFFGGNAYGDPYIETTKEITIDMTTRKKKIKELEY